MARESIVFLRLNISKLFSQYNISLYQNGTYPNYNLGPPPAAGPHGRIRHHDAGGGLFPRCFLSSPARPDPPLRRRVPSAAAPAGTRAAARPGSAARSPARRRACAAHQCRGGECRTWGRARPRCVDVAAAPPHPAGDPHPGNIMLTEDGKVALIDFGQVIPAFFTSSVP